MATSSSATVDSTYTLRQTIYIPKHLATGAHTRMSIRVVARIRPQQKSEFDKDVIVSACQKQDQNGRPDVVKIPNPKNEGESFAFQFSSVYDSQATQQDVFDNEVSPTIKSLFNGLDVTIFAYGSTGTGKTHTMVSCDLEE